MGGAKGDAPAPSGHRVGAARTIDELQAENELLRKLVVNLALANAELHERIERPKHRSSA
jgi:hypothetical protein